MIKFEDQKRELLKNPEVKREYDALKFEFDVRKALLDARNRCNLTQKQLSEISGVTQADISRIENGTRNPSLEVVSRLLYGLGVTLEIKPVYKD